MFELKALENQNSSPLENPLNPFFVTYLQLVLWVIEALKRPKYREKSRLA
jgi:hypothetical protein